VVYHGLTPMVIKILPLRGNSWLFRSDRANFIGQTVPV